MVIAGCEIFFKALAVRITTKKIIAVFTLAFKNGIRKRAANKRFAKICEGITHRFTGVLWVRKIEMIWKEQARDASAVRMAVILSEMPKLVVSLARYAPIDVIAIKYSNAASKIYARRLVL